MSGDDGEEGGKGLVSDFCGVRFLRGARPRQIQTRRALMPPVRAPLSPAPPSLPLAVRQAERQSSFVPSHRH